MQTTQTEPIAVGTMTIRFLVEGTAPHESVAVFECDVPSGTGMHAPHSHDAFEETIYGLRGVTTWTIDGANVDVEPGAAVCVPRGAVHGFANERDEDATFLAIATPGRIGPAFFTEVGAILEVDGPPDFAALGETMLRHGLTPATT